MWAMMAETAIKKDDGSDAFYANKLTTARYYVERILPKAGAHLAMMKAGSESMMALTADAF